MFACAGTGGDLEAGTAGSSIAGGSVTAGQQAPPDRTQTSYDREQGDSDLDEGWLGQDPVGEEEQSSAEEHGCAGDQETGQQQSLAQQPQQLTYGSPQVELIARGLEAGLRREQSKLSAASGATGSSRRPRKEQSGLSGSTSGLAAALDGARGISRRLRQQQAGRSSDASGAGGGGGPRLDDAEQHTSCRGQQQDKETQEDVLTSGQSSEVCFRGGGYLAVLLPPIDAGHPHRWASWYLAGMMRLLGGETHAQLRGRDSGQQLGDVLISREGQTWRCTQLTAFA